MKVTFDGFFDLQVNGFAGVDFSDPEITRDSIGHASDAIRLSGVTRYLATLITSTTHSFAQCAKAIVASENPTIAGIHMEGPYISPLDGARGAHLRDYVTAASIDDFERRQEAADGHIVLVTLAPEVPGALALIEHLVKRNVRVAIGHTDATPAGIADAINAGATLSTHLGNGCPQMLPRHPNIIWEQLAADALHMSLIVDGHHLPAATVKAMVRAKGAERTMLVTDATAAAGCNPGTFTLAGVGVELDAEGRVAVPGAKNLAGSALAMNAAVGNTVRFTGMTLSDVLPMSSSIPAAYLGLSTAGRVLADWDEASCRLKIERVE
ncbi:MAG: amidohydrolase family protein [Acidobacteriota bacterium]